MPRADGPFQIIEWYEDNAYKVDLPEQYGVFPIFNIGDLRPYYDDSELRTIRAEEGGNAPRPSLCEQNKDDEIIRVHNTKDTNINIWISRTTYRLKTYRLIIWSKPKTYKTM